VVDFIDVGLGDSRFYIFNLADAAITIGALVLWFAFREPSSPHAPTGAVGA
jgi:lipoprotein signal peptidase